MISLYNKNYFWDDQWHENIVFVNDMSMSMSLFWKSYIFLYKCHEMHLRVVIIWNLIASKNVKIRDVTYLLMFNMFFQHCFVQIFSHLAKFCKMQIVVGRGGDC